MKGPVLRATASILPESASGGAEPLLRARYPVAIPVIGSLYKLVRLVRQRRVESSVYLQITLR